MLSPCAGDFASAGGNGERVLSWGGGGNNTEVQEDSRLGFLGDSDDQQGESSVNRGIGGVRKLLGNTGESKREGKETGESKNGNRGTGETPKRVEETREIRRGEEIRESSRRGEEAGESTKGGEEAGESTEGAEKFWERQEWGVETRGSEMGGQERNPLVLYRWLDGGVSGSERKGLAGDGGQSHERAGGREGGQDRLAEASGDALVFLRKRPGDPEQGGEEVT
jgi:hypothetical protein